MAAVDSDIQASGGDYATIPAWHSAVPSSPTGLQRGLLAAEDFPYTSDLSLSGKSPSSASNAVICTTQPDASFIDASPFVGYYTTSKARVTSSSSHVTCDVTDTWTWYDGVQFNHSGTGALDPIVLVNQDDGANLKNCLGITTSTGVSVFAAESPGSMQNCLGIATSDSIDAVLSVRYSTAIYNCNAVVPSDQSPSGVVGILSVTSSPVLENCCSFGANTDYSGTWGTSTNNASDGTGSPGSNPQDSLTFADQFVSTINDFAMKSGSGLIDTGITASENPLDVLGRTRDAGADGDIGWMEGPAVTLTRDQHAFRCFDDDDNEADSTALAAEDTDAETDSANIVQGRVGIQYVGDPPAEAMQWEYKEDGDADTEFRKMT